MAYILHSVSSGHGPVIVMLHGYLSSGHYFKHIRNELQTDYRIVTLDLLGFGQSPKPKVDYTYDDHIAAIHKTLDTLNLPGPFILLGHSMGALIALRYNAQYPDNVTKLLLFNPPLFTDRKQMVTAHKATARRYRIMLYSRSRHIYWRLLRFLPRSRSGRRKAMSLSDIVSMSPQAREGSYRHVIGGANVFYDLRKVATPTLLAIGKYDREIYLENLHNRVFPANVSVQIIDADHHPFVRSVQLTSKLIRSYLL